MYNCSFVGDNAVIDGGVTVSKIDFSPILLIERLRQVSDE